MNRQNSLFVPKLFKQFSQNEVSDGSIVNSVNSLQCDATSISDGVSFFSFKNSFIFARFHFPFLQDGGWTRDFSHDIFSESQPLGDRLWPPEARH